MRGTWSSLICNGYGSEVTKVCYDKEKIDFERKE